MADDKGKDSVLGDKGEFEKHGTGPGTGGHGSGEDAKARDEMGHMAETTKGPGTSGGGSSAGNKT